MNQLQLVVMLRAYGNASVAIGGDDTNGAVLLLNTKYINSKNQEVTGRVDAAFASLTGGDLNKPSNVPKYKSRGDRGCHWLKIGSWRSFCCTGNCSLVQITRIR